MKHQQVVIDYVQMLKTSVTSIVLVCFVWIFVKYVCAATHSDYCRLRILGSLTFCVFFVHFTRLVHMAFVFPSYLQRQRDNANNSNDLVDALDEDLSGFLDDADGTNATCGESLGETLAADNRSTEQPIVTQNSQAKKVN